MPPTKNEMEPKGWLSVYLPSDLRIRVKVAAARADMSVSKWIVQLIEQALDDE